MYDTVIKEIEKDESRYFALFGDQNVRTYLGVYKCLGNVYKAKKDKSFAEMAKMSFDDSF